MGIEKLTAADFTKGCFGTNTLTDNVDISVSAGEFLSPQDLMIKIMMKLLKTTDVETAKRFISAVDLSAEKEPVRTQKDGEFFYRFEPSEKLKKIIDLYGTASTSVFVSGSASKILSNTPQRNSAAPSQDRRNQVNNLQVSLLKNRITGQLPGKIFKKPVEPKLPNTVSAQNKQTKNSDWIPVELNPKDFITLSGKKGKETATVIAGDKDPRREILESAVRKLFGGEISDDILSEFIQKYSDDNAMRHIAKADQTVMSREESLAGLEYALKKGERYFFYVKKSVVENLQRAQIEKYGSDEDKVNLKIQDKLKAIDEEFDKITIQNDLQKAFVELSRENAKKDAIDEIISQSKADLRSPTEAGNSIADSFEKTVRFFVESHPVYRFLPETAKQQLVNFGVGIGRGATELAGAAAGVNNFFRDIITDITIAGAEKSGIDVGRLKTAVEISRRSEQRQWEQILNARTAEMARGEFGYQAKQNNGIRTTVYDTPNWAANAGDMTAQALPFLIIGAATGGASIGVQVLATSAMGASQGLGSDYIRTQNAKSAVFAAAVGAAQGAAGPISAKLPFPADVAANAALGYIVAKVQNPNADDARIMQSIIMQAAQSGAFKIGSELHQRLSQKAGRTLSPNELQTEFGRELAKNFEIVKTEAAVASAKQTEAVVKQIQVEAVAKNLEGGGNLRASAQKAIREAVSDWGSRNKIFTKSVYDSVSFKNLAQGAKAIDPNLLPIGAAAVLSVKAGYHIEAGAVAFKDFSKLMLSEARKQGIALSQIRPKLEEFYRNAIEKINQGRETEARIVIDEKGINEARIKQIEIRYAEISREGHPVQRHGEHITEQQLDSRAMYGIDPVTGTTDDAYNKFPDGTPKPHAFGKNATKFTSKEALVKAEEFIKNSQEYKDALAVAERNGDEVFPVSNTRLEAIFGTDYKQEVFGKTRIGTKNNPIGTIETDFTDGTVTAVFRKNINGEWYLHSIYPEPKN